jgi:hypothetical protein
MLVKAIDLANASGKSQAYISAETKRGNLLRDKNRNYDLEQPVNLNWLAKTGLKKSDIKPKKKPVIAKAEKKKVNEPPIKKSQSKVKKKQPVKQEKAVKSDQKPTPKKEPKSIKKPEKLNPIDEKKAETLSPIEFEELTDMPGNLKNLTLEQLVLEHTNIKNVQQYAKTLDTIMSALKKSVEIKKIKQELIDRNFVKSHVMSYLNVLSDRIFNYCGNDGAMLKEFSGMIKEAQQSIDGEFDKLQKIQEAAADKK